MPGKSLSSSSEESPSKAEGVVGVAETVVFGVGVPAVPEAPSDPVVTTGVGVSVGVGVATELSSVEGDD
jgi:hypothetical protein